MKIDMLTQEVEKLLAGNPMVRLSASLIRPSSWKNRHEDSFKSDEFESLKSEIRAAGGNVQPIKVRPIAQESGSPFKYEIVFGRRRHRACLECGLEVLAIIEAMDDTRLFVEMDRENRGREDLRPFELGEMYVDALDRGLFSSQRKLADEVGADQGNVSKVVTLARFPSAVLQAFVSPLDVQYRWITPISQALDSEADVLLERAKAIATARKAGVSISSQEAYSRLIGKSSAPRSGKARKMEVAGKTLYVSQRGRRVAFEVDGLAEEHLKQVEEFIAGLMAEPK